MKKILYGVLALLLVAGMCGVMATAESAQSIYGASGISSTTNLLVNSVSLGTNALITNYPDDGVHFALDPTDGTVNGNLILTTWANRFRDHDNTASATHPTLKIYANTNVDSDNTDWGSIYANGTSLVFDHGAGLNGGMIFQHSGSTIGAHSFSPGVTSQYHQDAATVQFRVSSLTDDTIIASDGGAGSGDNNIVFSSDGNRGTDFSLARSNRPTLWLHSGDSITGGLNKTEHMMLMHDGTNGIINTASGDLILDSNSATVRISDTLSFDTGFAIHKTIDPGALVLGPNAPGFVNVGTFRGLGFDADAEEAYLNWEVPPNWDGASNMTFEIHWTPQPGSAMSNTETVKWDISYRSKAAGEGVGAGNATAGTVTYTQSGAGTDGEFIESGITLVYNDADNPLTANDMVGFQITRDFSGDSYASDAVIQCIHIEFTSNAMPAD